MIPCVSFTCGTRRTRISLGLTLLTLLPGCWSWGWFQNVSCSGLEAPGTALLAWPLDDQGELFRCIPDSLPRSDLFPQRSTVAIDDLIEGLDEPFAGEYSRVVLFLPPDPSPALRVRGEALVEALCAGRPGVGAHLIVTREALGPISSPSDLQGRLVQISPSLLWFGLGMLSGHLAGAIPPGEVVLSSYLLEGQLTVAPLANSPASFIIYRSRPPETALAIDVQHSEVGIFELSELLGELELDMARELLEGPTDGVPNPNPQGLVVICLVIPADTPEEHLASFRALTTELTHPRFQPLLLLSRSGSLPYREFTGTDAPLRALFTAADGAAGAEGAR